MDKDRFVAICKELEVSDQMTAHIWAEHRPPDHVSEETVRKVVPLLVVGHELMQALMDDSAAA